MTAIPVQRLNAKSRQEYLAHLAALAPDDLRLRFGNALSQAALAAYV